jgi:hypothetical protein
VVIDVGHPPVRPATRWLRMVSMASGGVIAGRMVVSRRASLMVKIHSYRAGRNFTFHLVA